MTKGKNDRPRKFVRVGRVRIEKDKIVLTELYRPWRSWRMRCEDFSNITLQRVFSLFDEIGFYLTAEKTFFLTDAIPGSHDLSAAMSFNQIFGEDWYQRAESGETLVHTRSGDEVEAVS